ncbi:MAG: multiheme c-type cytochrome [Luteolibacter sp.]
MRRVKREYESSVKTVSLVLVASIPVLLSGALNAELFPTGKVLGSESCSTSGCHGGAGPNRGAHTIWKRYDPHTASASTLASGMSERMAARLNINDATQSKSCTVCHAPNRQVSPSMFADPALVEKNSPEMNTVSCANCHGGAEKWILSHTRPDYPRGALRKLGMRQLDSSYERANSCVACHQNLSDDLVAARHPPLVFELDGMLIAEAKHWRENKEFSHTQTWLVGQAVALREVAAQAISDPGKPDEFKTAEKIEGFKKQRNAEVEAIKELLKACGTSFKGEGKALVKEADDYAKLISTTPISVGQTRDMLGRLLKNNEPFRAGAFEDLPKDYRSWASGYYAERLALAIDRLNESLIQAGQKDVIADEPLNALFDAAKPPVAFDSVASDVFLAKLAAVAESFSSNP